MAGYKGKQGRKSWDKEIAMKEIWNLSLPVIKYALTNSKVSLDTKIAVAKEMFGKMIPKDMKVEGANINSILYNIQNSSGLNENMRRIANGEKAEDVLKDSNKNKQRDSINSDSLPSKT